MSSELSQYDHTSISRVDLFVFPVYDGMKFYALTFDVKRGRILVFDSTNVLKEDCLLEKYGVIIDHLANVLGEYLHLHGDPIKKIKMLKAKKFVVHIKWGNKSCMEASGIYLMRHIETYMGETPCNWVCGLPTNPERHLIRLRTRYCATMIGWTNNYVKDDVMRGASTYYQNFLSVPDEKMEKIFG
ncbi:uncharacterized protein LOC131020725 [Salvia miltiorrhiza]|uniref:uncharacterized protein LOC130996606 n=1 Tax=Salvia miltiorrhiza TaxID=226208 RepID=UPI0025AB8350|nr:uncharacterized protein LOC130996606 [Salvia miltiorrhiza]XP_057805717.1 uncharacterized protein LOC131020725 [Salvia miltiorrhiza]